ncbi:MAG: winged helix DNA-binding domain-containing protein [Polyangiaceae bacterium]
MTTVLTAAALNRATLARQMLLARQKASVVEAVHLLGGLQAQLARPPHIALWSRIEGFRREELTEAATRRDLVRGTLMRGTLHLVTPAEYALVRPQVQPMLTKSIRSVLRERAAELDIDALVKASRDYLSAGPRTFEEIRDHLTLLKLPGDERARGFAVRMSVPLVQVPDGSAWGWPGESPFALADAWLKQSVFETDASRPEPAAERLVTWYLAAFGPASVADAQSWSGIASLKEAFEALRPRLVTFRDERKRELFDLPDAPRPDAETEAPVRLLPEFDALGLAHDDRSRLVDEAHKKLLFRPNLRNPPMFLVNGRVAGTWEIDPKKKKSTVELTAFAKIPKKSQDALAAEAESLSRFIEPTAKDHEVRFISPSK